MQRRNVGIKAARRGKSPRHRQTDGNINIGEQAHQPQAARICNLDRGADERRRKRFQSGTRAALDFFEVEDGTGRIKVNPLAHWAPDDVRAYMTENRLPRHPLVAKGYPSIGCAPCTSPVAEGEDPRAGRWRNQNKEECGIHVVDGKFVRTGA